MKQIKGTPKFQKSGKTCNSQKSAIPGMLTRMASKQFPEYLSEIIMFLYFRFFDVTIEINQGKFYIR